MSFLYKKKNFLNYMKNFVEILKNGGNMFPNNIHINSTKWPSHNNIPINKFTINVNPGETHI